MDTVSFVEIRPSDRNFALLSFQLRVFKTISRLLPRKRWGGGVVVVRFMKGYEGV